MTRGWGKEGRQFIFVVSSRRIWLVRENLEYSRMESVLYFTDYYIPPYFLIY